MTQKFEPHVGSSSRGESGFERLDCCEDCLDIAVVLTASDIALHMI